MDGALSAAAADQSQTPLAAILAAAAANGAAALQPVQPIVGLPGTLSTLASLLLLAQQHQQHVKPQDHAGEQPEVAAAAAAGPTGGLMRAVPNGRVIEEAGGDPHDEELDGPVSRSLAVPAGKEGSGAHGAAAGAAGADGLVLHSPGLKRAHPHGEGPGPASQPSDLNPLSPLHGTPDGSDAAGLSARKRSRKPARRQSWAPQGEQEGEQQHKQQQQQQQQQQCMGDEPHVEHQGETNATESSDDLVDWSQVPARRRSQQLTKRRSLPPVQPWQDDDPEGELARKQKAARAAPQSMSPAALAQQAQARAKVSKRDVTLGRGGLWALPPVSTNAPLGHFFSMPPLVVQAYNVYLTRSECLKALWFARQQAELVASGGAPAASSPDAGSAEGSAAVAAADGPGAGGDEGELPEPNLEGYDPASMDVRFPLMLSVRVERDGELMRETYHGARLIEGSSSTLNLRGFPTAVVRGMVRRGIWCMDPNTLVVCVTSNPHGPPPGLVPAALLPAAASPPPPEPAEAQEGGAADHPGTEDAEDAHEVPAAMGSEQGAAPAEDEAARSASQRQATPLDPIRTRAPLKDVLLADPLAVLALAAAVPSPTALRSQHSTFGGLDSSESSDGAGQEKYSAAALLEAAAAADAAAAGCAGEAAGADADTVGLAARRPAVKGPPRRTPSIPRAMTPEASAAAARTPSLAAALAAEHAALPASMSPPLPGSASLRRTSQSLQQLPQPLTQAPPGTFVPMVPLVFKANNVYLSCLACTAALGLPSVDEQQKLLQLQLDEAGLPASTWASALPLVDVQLEVDGMLLPQVHRRVRMAPSGKQTSDLINARGVPYDLVRGKVRRGVWRRDLPGAPSSSTKGPAISGSGSVMVLCMSTLESLGENGEQILLASSSRAAAPKKAAAAAAAVVAQLAGHGALEGHGSVALAVSPPLPVSSPLALPKPLLQTEQEAAGEELPVPLPLQLLGQLQVHQPAAGELKLPLGQLGGLGASLLSALQHPTPFKQPGGGLQLDTLLGLQPSAQPSPGLVTLPAPAPLQLKVDPELAAAGLGVRPVAELDAAACEPARSVLMAVLGLERGT